MLNSTNPSVGKGTVRQGLEDAVVTGGIAGVSALIAGGPSWPPEATALWTALLAGLIGGLLAFARARQIQVPPKP